MLWYITTKKYIPLIESAYTWVTPTSVQWNRPTLKKKTRILLFWFMYRYTKKKTAMLLYTKVSDVNMVQDHIEVMHFDQFDEAIIKEYCCGDRCHCPLLCCGEQKVILVDINKDGQIGVYVVLYVVHVLNYF